METFNRVSDVARIRPQIELESQASQQGLSGLAMVASHKFINQRMQLGAERVLRLLDEGKHEEAKALLFSDDLWSENKEA